jgi:hypothetical protein
LETSRSFRGGQRDERRRRLLTDDLSSPDEQPASQVRAGDAAPPPKSAHYGDAAFLEHQLRLLDLVPRRWIALGALLTAAAATIVGLEAAYARMLQQSAAGTLIAAMQIDAKGSLACWFSSLVLLAASAAALITYTVRRHRTDDYRGRYRVWLWAAGCLFLMATDEAASLREGFRDLMIYLTGTPLFGDGALWWIAVYVIAGGAIGSRLLSDMRPSRLSMTALSAAAIAYCLAGANGLGWILAERGAAEIMFRTASEMAGNLLLLAAMLLHARYVILDAEGLLPSRKPPAPTTEAPADKEKTASSDGRRWMKIDPPHVAPPPAYQRPAAAPAATPVAASVSVSSADNHKLTKAERKALKARLLRERLERERRG